MRLSSFRIYNFKSIQDTELIKISKIDNITILAGQNESGKSSVLEALDFFENGPNENFEDYYRRLGTHPRVECLYLLNDEELETLKQESGDSDIKNHISENGIMVTRGKLESDEYSALECLKPEALSTSSPVEQAATETNETTEPVAPEFDFPNFFLNRRPKFLFYSSFDESVLPNKITKANLKSNKAITDFEAVFSVDFENLLNEPNDAARSKKLSEVNDSASDNLNTYWSQKISGERSDYKFKIEIHPQTTQPDESYINFFIDQGDGFPLHIGQKSKGFQWFSSFNLRLRAHKATSNNLNDFILLIDEPGQGLHEEAQKDAKKILEELAQSGVQMVFSTHQPQLLGGSDVDFSRLKLTTKDRAKGTQVRNVAQVSGQEGFKDALSPIRTALGQVSLDVNAFLDGKKVLIVEGITEYYYLNGWQRLTNTADKFIIIPCVSVSNAPSVYSILFGWGVVGKVLLDDDQAGTAASTKIKKAFLAQAEQAEIEKVLYKNAGNSGIENTFSATDFLKFAQPYIQPTNGANNSELGKDNKEIIARTFLDQVKSGAITLDGLEASTKSDFQKIIDFASQS